MEIKDVFAGTVLGALARMGPVDIALVRRLLQQIQNSALALGPHENKFAAEALRATQRWLAMSDAELAFQFMTAENSTPC